MYVPPHNCVYLYMYVSTHVAYTYVYLYASAHMYTPAYNCVNLHSTHQFRVLCAPQPKGKIEAQIPR